jgi:hypothetical protein
MGGGGAASAGASLERAGTLHAIPTHAISGSEAAVEADPQAGLPIVAEMTFEGAGAHFPSYDNARAGLDCVRKTRGSS